MDYPRVKGNKEYLAYRAKKRLTARQSILAKCYECMGFYVDGRLNCKIEGCPLYPYNPLSKLNDDISPIKEDKKG